MKFILICGGAATGKMTIGQALAKKTDFKLFYNHMSLELVNAFFDFGTPNFRNLDKKIRFSIFKEIANSDIDGLIFTMVWAFDDKKDEEYVDEIIKIFEKRNPQVHIVELQTDLEERLRRNRTENRLKHKPSKRNLDFSEKMLLHHNEELRLNSLEGEFPDKNIFKIDNTNLSPDEVAEKIINHFEL